MWGGWGSNPRPADHEKYGPVHRAHYLHGYQPASRFWHFQLIEGGWLLALSVLLAAATVWLIRHRAT